jgi:hypothetical protein
VNRGTAPSDTAQITAAITAMRTCLARRLDEGEFVRRRSLSEIMGFVKKVLERSNSLRFAEHTRSRNVAAESRLDLF